MKITQREKILLGILLFVLGGYLYFKLIYLTESEAIRNLKAQYQSKVIVLEQVNRKDARMKEIDAQLQQLRLEIKPIQSKISQSVRVPQILQETSQAAAVSSVVIDIIKFSGDYAQVKGKIIEDSNPSNVQGQMNPPGEGVASPQQKTTPQALSKELTTSDLKTLSLHLNFSCSYENLQQFLLYFENNMRYYVVDVLDINYSGNLLTGNLVIKTFSTVPPNELFNFNTSPDLNRISPFNKN